MTVKVRATVNSAATTLRWSRDETIPALQFLEAHVDLFLARLTELLNSYHGWSRSPAYYDLVCGEWLYHFSHLVYAAYLEVTRGLPVDRDLSPLPVFADHREFHRVTVDDAALGTQLRAVAARLLGDGSLDDATFAGSTITVGSSRASRRQRLSGLISDAIASPDAPFVFCDPYVKCSNREWYSALYKWRGWARQDNYRYPIGVRAEVDGAWRRGQSASVRVRTVVDLVNALLPLYVPVIFLEAFSAYLQQVHALRLPRPQLLYTANSLHEHTLFKTLAAEWREQGTKILAHQHGGGYGLGLIESTENFEIRVSDIFYSFGWSHPSGKVRPLSAPLSAAFRPQRAGRILLTTAALPRFVYRIHAGPMPGTIETMFAETEDFIRHITDRRDLVIRPRLHDFGWGFPDLLRREFAGVRFDDGRRSGCKSYGESALVVHGYLGTSWLETMALNIPTVCFYDTDAWAFRGAAQPFIDRLEAVGVLHRSGAGAARFVSGVRNDPLGWWQKVEVQDARRAFVRTYANYSRDWAAQWEAEFRSLL